MSERKITRFVMLFLLVFALFASGLQVKTAFAATQGMQGTITVIGENGTPLLADTPASFTPNENAFNALVSQVGTDNVKFTQYSFGKWIDSIDNLAGTSDYTKYWGFYINGISSQSGADSYIVQNQDHLIFRYIDTTQPSTNVSLKINGANNTVLHDFSGNKSIGITGEPTALQLLQVTLGTSKVGLKNTQYGPMITSIDNLAAQGNSYWAFYINGKMATVGAADYHLKPNDQISFQYETYVPSSGDSNNGNPSSAPAKISADVLQNSIDNASHYAVNNGVNDFEAIALKQAGKPIPSSYLDGVVNNIKKNGGKFHYITDAAKYTLGTLAAGANPTNIAGFNIVGSVYNGDATKQGLNGVAFALIALDSANFTVPSSAVWTKEKLINELLANQHQDGGWSLYTNSATSDPDITAMVLTALAPYKDQAGVKEKIATAVKYLSNQYLDSKIDNSNTAAYIVIALSALGIDANGSSFLKDHVSLMQNLLSYQNSDGGFAFHSGDQSDNAFSTPESLEALVAYHLYLNGKGSLYQLPLTSTAGTSHPATALAPTISHNLQQGHPLPKTATNAGNFILFGIILLILGMIFYRVNGRKA